MRKYFVIAMLFILILSSTACRENDVKQNFLGGYGEITQGAYADAYVSVFFADDIYIYFDNYKINKESGQWLNLCESPGCRHETPECLEYKYRNRVFPGYDQIFYVEGKNLYEISNEGDTEYIAAFDTDSNGISLSDDVSIELVRPLGHDIVYIMCQEGSCIYNIQTKEKIYTATNMCCGNDNEIYYYDIELDGIVRADIETMQTEFLENTEGVYPCFCNEGKVYCNTGTGIICSIDQAGDTEVVLAEEGLRYSVLGMNDGRIYYLLTDVNIATGEYTNCELYSSLPDGAEREKIDVQNLKPDMNSFFGKDGFYLLESGNFGGVKSVYAYSFDTKMGNTYLVENGEDNLSDKVSIETNSDSNGSNSEEQMPKKSFAMATNFYAETADALTGNESLVAQKTIPFIIDGDTLKTTFSYNVEVQGYPSEGQIHIFVMCDGILQKLSVNGNEPSLINSCEYRNKEDMCAELEFTLGNSSDNQQIVIGYYLDDSIITDSLDTFSEYNEAISYTTFMYELENGYTLEKQYPPVIYSEKDFNDVYTYEEGESYEVMVNTDIALISDAIPIKRQQERWNLQIEKNSSCYAVFHSQSGSYNMYLLVDNVPVTILEGAEGIMCTINGEFDTVVLDIGIDEIVKDTEQHNVKIMVYNRQTGNVQLFPAQIVQAGD